MTVFTRDSPLYLESATGKLEKYPRSRVVRWSVRLALAAPYVLFVVWFNFANHHDWSGTANAALVDRVAQVGAGQPSVMSHVFPPITSVLALLVPGGAFGLAIVGALTSGILLQLFAQSFVRKKFALWLRIVMLGLFVLNPVWVYLLATNLETTLGLTFFGLGMVALVRFVTYANTQAGFRAGLLFAASALSDSTMIFAAIIGAAAATLIVQSRRDARMAHALVVAFPTVAVVGSLVVLSLLLHQGPFALIRTDLGFRAERTAAMAAFFSSPQAIPYLAATVIVVLASIALGFAVTGLVAVVLTATTSLAILLGMAPIGITGVNVTMMMLLALAIVPRPLTVRMKVATVVVALMLAITAWITAALSPDVLLWWDAARGLAGVGQ